MVKAKKEEKDSDRNILIKPYRLKRFGFISVFIDCYYTGGKQMAVKIRLRRMGRKKRPFYRVIVADSRSPRNGRFIEEIGWDDPLQDPGEIKIDEEKAKKWLANGAQPTDTARSLLKKSGIIE